ncbi:hypothetical protein [Caballeronia sp.]|uniref:hypothetical protein n=1 Tax=Caballeronia sp. TaxID=1931223 RepID=UPI003C41B489
MALSPLTERGYAAYVDFMQKWGVTKQKIPASGELITNDLINEINDFNQAEIIAMAKAYKEK